MADYKLTIENHPSQARHPISDEPLFKDGKPVPLFPDQRSIKLDGTIIAYVNAAGKVMFIMPENKLPGTIADEALDLAASEYGGKSEVHFVAPVLGNEASE